MSVAQSPPIDTAFQNASALIKSALFFDEQGDFSKAAPLYRDSLDLLTDVLKATPASRSDAENQKKGREFFEKCHARLTKLKERHKIRVRVPSAAFLKKVGPAASAGSTRTPPRASRARGPAGNASLGAHAVGAQPGGTKAQARPRPVDASPEALLQRCVRSPHCRGLPRDALTAMLNECCTPGQRVAFEDIVGLEFVKEALNELIVFPALNPQLFRGLRAPPKGVLLFGPPGNGKTMIARAVAAESGMLFLNISASSLTSKWVGSGEKNARALFSAARALQPCIIFIDEVDSILTGRSSGEHEASRRLKTELLVQMDGVSSSDDDRVLVLAATNRPQELDDAALRRFSKRVHIPLPAPDVRAGLVAALLAQVRHDLTEKRIRDVAQRLDGYSCSDITQLIKDAAMGPLRDLARTGKLKSGCTEHDLRPVRLKDIKNSMKIVRPSINPVSLQQLEKWADAYGATGV